MEVVEAAEAAEAAVVVCDCGIGWEEPSIDFRWAENPGGTEQKEKKGGNLIKYRNQLEKRANSRASCLIKENVGLIFKIKKMYRVVQKSRPFRLVRKYTAN